MIFMSQSSITDPARESAWDVWYAEHLDVMASVPGVSSAQRFRTEAPGHPRSLAMYTFASADIFKDPYYLSIRGQGEWQSLVDRRFYHRNLFDGLDATPDVPATSRLLVADRAEPETIPGFEFTWLRAVAIDRSTPYRGIAVVSEAVASRVPNDGRIAVHRPVSVRIKGR